MALGDAIKVAIDAGQRTPEEVTIKRSGPGGGVRFTTEDGLVKVIEFNKAGVMVQCLVVRPERLVSLHELPKRG